MVRRVYGTGDGAAPAVYKSRASHACNDAMQTWRRYVESRAFAPPQKRLQYPEDVAADGVTLECQAVFAATGVPSVCCKHAAARRVVVFFHGNSANIADDRVTAFARQLSDAASADVYSPEFPGYHGKGAPSEAALAEAAAAFVTALKARTENGMQFLVAGYSLGSYPALVTAPLADGVLLVAPLYSALSVVLAQKPWALGLAWLWRPIDLFRNAPLAAAHGKPQLVVGAAKDAVIPSFQGRALRGSYVELAHATHVSAATDPETFEAISAFLGVQGCPTFKKSHG